MPQSKHAPALRWLAGSLTVAAVAALALFLIHISDHSGDLDIAATRRQFFKISGCVLG